MPERQATIMAGIPAHNMALYHRIRFVVGDPAVLIEVAEQGTVDGDARSCAISKWSGPGRTPAWIRWPVPRQFAPAGGLSGDRETATAQSAAEFLRRQQMTRVTADRSLPMIYVHALQAAGIEVECDLDLGVTVRRAKDAEEIEHLRESQQVTEQAIEMACSLSRQRPSRSPGRAAVGRRSADVGTRARGHRRVSARNAVTPTRRRSWQAGRPARTATTWAPESLYTGQPVIVDVFPQNRADTLLRRLHAHGRAWRGERRAGPHARCRGRRQGGRHRSGPRGSHRARSARGHDRGDPTAWIRHRPAGRGCPRHVLRDGARHGSRRGSGSPRTTAARSRRTVLVVGDAVTVEPGLYCKAIGGLRLEDSGGRHRRRLRESQPAAGTTHLGVKLAAVG